MKKIFAILLTALSLTAGAQTHLTEAQVKAKLTSNSWPYQHTNNIIYSLMNRGVNTYTTNTAINTTGTFTLTSSNFSVGSDYLLIGAASRISTEALSIQYNYAGMNQLRMTNSTAGVVAGTQLLLSADVSTASLFSTSSSYITSGIFQQNTAVLLSSAGAGLNVGTSNAASTKIWTNNLERVTVLSDGKVGIGSTSPEALLEVQGAEATDAVISLDTDDGDDNADTWFIKSEASGNDLSLTNHTTKFFGFTSDGRLYGTALHNNAGSLTGTTNQYIASGTYTPTLTGVTNATIVATYQCQYMRVGNVVTVSGMYEADPGTTGLMYIKISLPIASTFSAASSAAGVASAQVLSSTAVESAMLLADLSTNEIKVSNSTADTASANWRFTFTYLIE